MLNRIPHCFVLPKRRAHTSAAEVHTAYGSMLILLPGKAYNME
jgi:hypothetical protein